MVPGWCWSGTRVWLKTRKALQCNASGKPTPSNCPNYRPGTRFFAIPKIDFNALPISARLVSTLSVGVPR